ncbi:hypothetical protein [Streptomyces scopuliridis]|uniref:recombination directionality factor n=1 Tax=Streptomyces scopuliridis TaxID=452529 RepID=UPI0036D03D80
MTLRIFETDPDAAPKPKRSFASDTVGRFRSGRMVGRRPESLNEWRVTSGDPETASAIVQLFGGVAEEWETTGEDALEVLTNAKAVGVIIDGPKSIVSDMRMYANNALFHHCDGVEFLSPEEKRGTACGCPRLLKERKAYAKTGGPKPNIDMRFRLFDDPDLGYFRFVSSSWDLASALPALTKELEGASGPVHAELRIEEVSFEAKNGPMAGQTVTYNKPVIDVIGPWTAPKGNEPPY